MATYGKIVPLTGSHRHKTLKTNMQYNICITVEAGTCQQGCRKNYPVLYQVFYPPPIGKAMGKASAPDRAAVKIYRRAVSVHAFIF